MKPKSWRDVMPLVRAVYARHCAGCCLHILADDGNVQDHNAKFCLEQARTRKHADCEAAAAMLLAMSKTQRAKVYTASDKNPEYDWRSQAN